MKTTMLIKLDKKLKTEVQQAAKSVGLPLSAIVVNYLKQFAADQSVTFSAPMPNKATIRAIKQAEKDYAAGKLKRFKTMEAFLKDTNS